MKKENIAEIVMWILKGVFLYGTASGLYGIQLGIVGGYVRLFTMMVLSGAVLAMMLLDGIVQEEKKSNDLVWGIEALLLMIAGIGSDISISMWIAGCALACWVLKRWNGIAGDCAKSLSAFLLTGRIFARYVRGLSGYAVSMFLFFLVLAFFFQKEAEEKKETVWNDWFLLAVKGIRQLSFSGIMITMMGAAQAMRLQGSNYQGMMHTGLLVILFLIHFVTGMIENRYAFENEDMHAYASIVIRGVIGSVIAFCMLKAGIAVFLIGMLAALVPIAVWYLLQFTSLAEERGFEIACYLTLAGGMLMLMMLYNGVSVDGQLITLFVMSQVSLLWI